MTLAHPLLALSVKMVTLPELETTNWFLSYLHTIAHQGVGGLYSGIRASLLFAALPINHIWLGEDDDVTTHSLNWINPLIYSHPLNKSLHINRTQHMLLNPILLYP